MISSAPVKCSTRGSLRLRDERASPREEVKGLHSPESLRSTPAWLLGDRAPQGQTRAPVCPFETNTQLFLLTWPFKLQFFFWSQIYNFVPISLGSALPSSQTLGVSTLRPLASFPGLQPHCPPVPIHTHFFFNLKKKSFTLTNLGGNSKYLLFCHRSKLGFCTFTLCNTNILEEMFSCLYQLGLGLTELQNTELYLRFIYKKPWERQPRLVWHFHKMAGARSSPLAFLPPSAHGFHLMVQGGCSVSFH